LISGQTGTGKDLAAAALHRLNPASGRFVALNCSAVIETLFECELFGHVKGSFTGATADKVGLIEYADGGTLFLDEIGDMPLASQAKLLRVLQNQETQRVGSLSARKLDIRVIAATNHDLRASIASKRFREDLYYRLAMVEIKLPRLEERKEDIPLLERHFIARFAAEYKKEIRELTPCAHVVLASHSWPGNVRELQNELGHACMMATGEFIEVEDLPAYLLLGSQPMDAPHRPHEALDALAEQEFLLLQCAMERAGLNQSEAARILRIGRDALRYKLKKYGLVAAAGCEGVKSSGPVAH
jgi:DNA-binding NtrC family response regulator